MARQATGLSTLENDAARIKADPLRGQEVRTSEQDAPVFAGLAEVTSALPTHLSAGVRPINALRTTNAEVMGNEQRSVGGRNAF